MPAPNRLLVADFTYVKLVTGAFCYVAFVIDAYAGMIIGWKASGSKETRFVESVIRPPPALGSRQGHTTDGAIHHSDGSQRLREPISVVGSWLDSVESGEGRHERVRFEGTRSVGLSEVRHRALTGRLKSYR